MKVAFIAYGPVDRRSGGYLYDYHLISALKERGHTVTLVSQADGSLFRKLLENGRSLAVNLEETLADLIVADELNHPSLFLTMKRIRTAGAPVVALVHHLKSLERLPAPQKTLYRYMERSFLLQADVCLFNSDETGESVARLLGRKPANSRVVYPGADNPLRKPIFREGPMRVLFVGNIIPRKGLNRLLLALGRMEGGNWELDVVGDESSDPEYAALCRKISDAPELDRRIRFHGRLEELKLEQFRKECEVLAVPSDHEGFGIVYLEAMRSGMIPVAAADGGARNLISSGVNGFLVSEEDPDSLFSVLSRLERDPELRFSIARNAHRRGKDFPDWNTAMNIAVDFLEEVHSCR